MALTIQEVQAAQQGKTREELAQIAQQATLPAYTAPITSPTATPASSYTSPYTPSSTSSPINTSITARLPNETPEDLVNRIYAFASEQDFFSRTGEKDFSNVKTIQRGQKPTSTFYKYADDKTVYQQTPQTQTSVQTSDPARRKAALERIKSELNSGIQAPSPYNSSQEFQKLRQEQGVVKDEEELAAIRNEANLGKQELRQFSATAGQGVSEGGRIGAMSEAERNLNFRLEGLAIREQAVLSRLNSKNAYISTAIKLGQEDYNVAYQNYTDEFNKNLKVVDLYNQELDDQQKDALTGLTTITNLLSKTGGEITPELSTQLDSLALQAGLPTGLFSEASQALIQENEKVLSPMIVDTETGKNVYFFTQGKDGTPHLKQMLSLSGETPGTSIPNTTLKQSPKYTVGPTLPELEGKIKAGTQVKQPIQPRGLPAKTTAVKFKAPTKTIVDKYDLPKNVSSDDYENVRTGLRAIQKEYNITSLSDEERYKLWGEAANELENLGYNPDDFDALLWEVFHPEGLNGYYKYNKPAMYKAPKEQSNTITNPFLTR